MVLVTLLLTVVAWCDDLQVLAVNVDDAICPLLLEISDDVPWIWGQNQHGAVGWLPLHCLPARPRRGGS